MGILDKLGLASSASASKRSKVDYTCKMHPDVHTGAPDKCPECGMKLVQSDDSIRKGNAGASRHGCC